MPVLKNGSLLGDFAIIGLIARGGMGEVYEAHENKLDRRVALKVVLQNTQDHESEDLVRRFMQEARTLAKVNHPNIVTIHSIQKIDNLQFIAMEYVEGVSLKQFLEEYTIPIEIALFLFEQILSGLKRLHDHGIVHRDLKPSNILIRVDGQIKILDFGIAKSAESQHNTNPGVTVGTPPYMAPEMRNFKGATMRSDFWSLGAIFFECLTGKLLVLCMEGDEFKFTPNDLKDIPPEMRAIIAAMSAPQADERYRNANEILDDLHRLRETIGQASPAALEIFRDQLRDLTENTRIKDKSVVRSVTVPKFDIDLSTSRGSEKMESSIRVLNRTAPPSRKPPKVPESRSSKRKRRNKTFFKTAAICALMAGAYYFRGYVERLPVRNPFKLSSLSSPFVSGASAMQLIEPADRTVVWLEPAQNPTLTWSRVLAAREYDIQMALDAEFKRIVLNEPANGNSHIPVKPLAEGNYYWRLVPSASSKGQPSPAQSFTLARLEPVIQVKPLAGEKVEVASSEGGPADFEWACRMGARQYNVQVASDPTFKKLAASKIVNDCRWTNVELPPGRYFWRVRLELGPHHREIWSSTRIFAVVSTGRATKGERPANLAAPLLKTPKQTVFLNISAKRTPASKVEKVVELAWKPVAGARQYHLQISYSKDLAGPVADERTSGTLFKWKASAPGTLYWRVSAVDVRGNVGPGSGMGQVEIMLPAPSLKNEYAFNLLEKVPTVDWRPLPMTTQYLVQVGSKKDLQGVRAKVVFEPKFTVPAAAGRYFIRVAAADVSGVATSPFSEVASVKVQQVARAPAASAFVMPPKPLSPISGVTAPSKNGRMSIEFQWTPVPKADSYSLELANDPEFTEVIERTNSGQAKSLLEQVEMKGRVYWRVKATSRGKSSGWSESFYFDVK